MADGNGTSPKKKNKHRMRLGIVLLIACALMLVTFCIYMSETTLEDVLADERGEGVIITHTDSDD